MSDARRKRCTCCGGHTSEVGPISWRGNCRACGEKLMVENIVGIAEQRGYAHKRRLRGYLRYAERALLTTTGEERSV